MRRPLTPLPGRVNAVDAQLSDARMAFENALSSATNSVDLWARYQAVVTQQARALRNVFSSDDVDRLLFTNGYRRVASFTPATLLSLADADPNPGGAGLQGFDALKTLLELEIRARADDLAWLRVDLQRASEMVTHDSHLVLADTNVYTNRPGRPDSERLVDIPWYDLFDPELPEMPERHITLLVPLIVVEELDKLKVRSDRGHAATAARHTIRDLNDLFKANPTDTAVVRPSIQSTDSVGRVEARLFFDPLGHVRLDRADDEILAVARQIHALTGQVVHLITGDAAAAFRARRYESRGQYDSELFVHFLAPTAPQVSRRQERRTRQDDSAARAIENEGSEVGGE